MKTTKHASTLSLATLVAGVAMIAACEQTATEPPQPELEDPAALFDIILDAPRPQAERAAERLAEVFGHFSLSHIERTGLSPATTLFETSTAADGDEVGG